MLADRIRSSSLILACAVAATVAGCRSENTGPAPHGEIDGAHVRLGSGTAYTYAVNGPSGPSALGVAFDRTALDGLPAADSMWTLPLPAGVGVAPFDHIEVDWNAQGHPPGPYMLPHFDVHFYAITPSAQSAIQGGSDTVPVPAAYVPVDYVSTVESVPHMGVHWIDTTSAELHGQTFDRTFIYGFTHGSFAFLEPMVTRAFLTSQPNTNDAIRQPQSFARAGRYPTRYRVYVDAPTNTVRVELDSLTAR